MKVQEQGSQGPSACVCVHVRECACVCVQGLSHSWECHGWMLLVYFGSEHSRAHPYFRCSMLFVNISLRGIFHALQGVRAEVSITAVRLGSLPPRRCGSGHHSACLGEGPGTWPAVLMVLRGLIWSITGPSSTRLREVQSLPGVRPQSAAATLRPACQHRTESCAPAHLQPRFPSGRLSHEKHRAKPRETGFAPVVLMSRAPAAP